ncbi:putative transmembrane protein [endosymbiont of Tevnia jerichonana (vent Tica)]|uniref:Putative transmembrane protein n=1 Tax=endosymbiont of Tevnia jerichonana (vent Tica) TaxID=1049564 RepID=G2FBX4_9GAMM|nr:DUF3999 domain-containing protein [endosymbiont of Tevnia jerichonana]EGW55805.1 putative transmembrane protein [endosymbiont of Tevnia jerichonana (vent Tica)]
MKSTILLSLLLLSTLAVADRTALAPADFAWGIRLHPSGERPLYELSVPLAVYQGVVRSDLGDLSLFNAQGSQVPHALQRLSSQQPAEKQLRQVKLFPLFGPSEATLQLIAMQMSQPAGDGQLALYTREIKQSQDEVLHGYLLQLWGDDEPPAVEGLILQWAAGERGFVQRLRLEQSDDLSHWSLLSDSAVIADLQHNGERLQRQRIPLGGQPARYLRLTPADQGRPIRLSGVQLELGGAPPVIEPESMVIADLQRVAAGEYRFQIPASLPLSGVEILPQEPNSLAWVWLSSRAGPKQAWRRRAAGLIYRLRSEGEPIVQTRLAVKSNGDRDWRLQLDPSGGGFGATPPRIVLRWNPHRLRFAARGAGPFLLAYGSVRVRTQQSSGLWQELTSGQQEPLIGRQLRLGVPNPWRGRRYWPRH